MQASTRSIHAGYFPKINVDGDSAYAELCLVSYGMGKEPASLEEVKGRSVWGKYRLQMKKDADGLWKIKDLRFYLADEKVYQLK